MHSYLPLSPPIPSSTHTGRTGTGLPARGRSLTADGYSGLVTRNTATCLSNGRYSGGRSPTLTVPAGGALSPTRRGTLPIFSNWPGIWNCYGYRAARLTCRSWPSHSGPVTYRSPHIRKRRTCTYGTCEIGPTLSGSPISAAGSNYADLRTGSGNLINTLTCTSTPTRAPRIERRRSLVGGR